MTSVIEIPISDVIGDITFYSKNCYLTYSNQNIIPIFTGVIIHQQ